MTTYRQLYFSFPMRLLALHFRNHLVLVVLWAALALMCTGILGRFFGMHYLLLTPEYMGQVDFWSFFLVGAAFGGFFMVWNLTTYLLAANRFPFLASLTAPFTKFCLNNSAIPIAFLVVYLASTIWFQWHDELTHTSDIIWNVAGFITGGITLITLLAAYLYFTNKDIGTFLRPRQFVPQPGGRLLAPGQRLPTLWEIQQGATRWRVDTYVDTRLHVRPVRSVAHYNPNMLAQVFRQNHFHAVVVQLVLVFLLMFQGMLMDFDWVRVPTGATLFILFGLIMALIGAIIFWFRSWSLLVFISMMVVVNFCTGQGWFNYRNRVYGIDYQKDKLAAYNYQNFQEMISPENISQDKATALHILENWRRKNQTPENPKPKMIFLCVSGGGLRSALWTMQTLQRADSICGGKLLKQSVLITGASGGMLGAAYIRELMLRRMEGIPLNEHDPVHITEMGRDLLNAVTFGLVSNDLFYPMSNFQSGNFEYRKDRGYLFEHQLNANCRNFFRRRLAQYRKPELRAQIPMMIFSPFVLNDGRRLLISPHGMSYMMSPCDEGRLKNEVEIDGIDFRQLFRAQEADSLAYSTAIRMNCTFPYILPNVWLPTSPATEAADAGYRDNYGLGLATRFVATFRDWIRENTSGVVMVQVRCWEKINPVFPSDNKGVMESLLTPASVATHLFTLQDFEQDNMLSLLDDALGRNRLSVLRFIYHPVIKKREASLSLHLSSREKQDLMEAWYSTDNQENVLALKRALE